MSRADKITTATKKDLFYSDFLVNLDKHPMNGSLARTTNEDSVKQSIRSLILTDIYERPYQPLLGSKIHSLLFEPMDELTTPLLQATIENTIRLYEPRANLLYVRITPVESRNEYTINIVFSLVNSNSEVKLDLIIKRIR